MSFLRCDNCRLKVAESLDVLHYVQLHEGVRIGCSDQAEAESCAERYHGSKGRKAFGKQESFFCPVCKLSYFRDKEKDSLVCLRCGKAKLKLAKKLLNKVCPRCKKGTIVAR